MKQAVEVPQVGESVSSGILATWLKADGDFVREGEELFELETDKATMAVPAPAAGVLKILVQVDEEVSVGAVVGEVDTEAAPPAADGEAPADSGPVAQGGAAPAAQAPADSAALSPAVRRILEENRLDAATVVAAVGGSGKDGRLTKADVERYLAGGAGDAGGARAGSGAPPTGAAPAVGGGGAPAAAPAELQERKKMTTLRRTIAENLVRSKRESAHLTTFNEVDMSAVMAIRGKYKDRFVEKHETRLGFMSFFLKAAQKALAEYREVNAYVDGTEIIYNNFYNIGVAISTDAGLIVPVIRNVDRLSFADIERAIVDFAQRAGQKRIMPDEFSGGTFTITNGGVFGSMLSTPIPSPPQTAVMGMHSINKRPVVVDDEIVIRPMMYLALTYDHRIIDGKQAIGFLNRIKAQIEDPVQLLLEL